MSLGACWHHETRLVCETRRVRNLVCNRISWTENVLNLPFAVYFTLSVPHKDICWEPKMKEGSKQHNFK